MTRSTLSLALLSLLLAACAGSPPVEDVAPADIVPAADADAASAPSTSAADPRDDAPVAPLTLDEVLRGDWRTPEYAQRDVYRHPKETLSFFGVSPEQTLIEITPGGGWYAEILAPYLRGRGQYIAAVWDDAIPDQPNYRYSLNKTLRAKFEGRPGVYGEPELRSFDPKAPQFGPAGSADTVLTFRNVHNWVSEGTAEAYFKGFFDVLKPGGTLGVVDHRAKPGTSLDTMKSSGYVTEALVIDLARKAGFVLEDRSQINANPRDTADHPKGVWSLPPSNQHEPAEAERYKAIGESDRMTLRFTKPRG